MPRFAASLNMLYAELPPLERIAAAAADGFEGIEFQMPYAHEISELSSRLSDDDVEVVLINTPPGSAEKGERGLAGLPGRESEFHASMEQALNYAAVMRCTRIHVLAGVVPPGVSRQRALDTYLTNLSWAAGASPEVTLMIEPINQRDMPGYLINRQADAHDIVRAVGTANVKVQMDLYHCQVTEGDLEAKLRHYMPSGNIGHLQIAGVPARHEPDSGEINYTHLLGVVDELGYDGWVGCEYRPAAGTRAGLGWMKPWRKG